VCPHTHSKDEAFQVRVDRDDAFQVRVDRDGAFVLVW
jgi:hypothetical protein